jgi:hypothetical protein
LAPEYRKSGIVDAIIEHVQDHHVTSEWFSECEITQALVLFYMKDLCDWTSKSTNDLLQGLLLRTGQTTELSTESTASILLALGAGLTYSVSNRDILLSSMQTLAQRLLRAQENGGWKPSPVGVFGFGRLYENDLFATSLAIHALSRYAAVVFQ